MKKNSELFFFFGITDATTFKSKLASDIHPLITSTTQLLSVSTQPITAVNIAFSQSGLTTLGVTDNLGDSLFAAGQTADATAIGDPGTGNWVPGFVGTSVHGVFLLASDTVDNVNAMLSEIQNSLGDSITEIHRLQGQARPGAEQGHERKFLRNKVLAHFIEDYPDFGFADGISQPAVTGFTANVLPGQTPVPAGEFLLGEDGDSVTRPAWAKDGSFLVFRQMEQLVPEFNKFLLDNPIVEPGVLTAQEGSDLLGARMVGRWKSVSSHRNFQNCAHFFRVLRSISRRYSTIPISALTLPVITTSTLSIPMKERQTRPVAHFPRISARRHLEGISTR